MQKNVNITVSEGDSMFCHEMSINFNPLQFILDFKSVTPRVDVRSKEGPLINIKHNVILLDPYHTKQMLQLLSRVVRDYETEFGKIEKPAAMNKFERNMRKKTKSATVKTESPSYFG